VPRRPWLVALGVAIAVLLGLSLLVRPTTPWVLLDWPGLYCLALVGAALAHLAGPDLGRTGHAPSWSLALALLAPAVFGLRVVSLLQYLTITPIGQRDALLVVGAAEALAVLAVGVPLARLAADMLPPHDDTGRLRRVVPTDRVATGSAMPRGSGAVSDHLTTAPLSSDLFRARANRRVTVACGARPERAAELDR